MEARHELAKYNETVTTLERDLNAAHDAETMLTEQVMVLLVG